VKQWRRVSFTRHRHLRPPENPDKQRGLQRPIPLFPSLPAVRTTSPAKATKSQQQSAFSFFFHSFRIFASLSAAPLFVSSPSLFQALGTVTKGLLANGSLSRLCSWWWLARSGERERWRWMFTVAERRADLLHAPPTDQTCGWLDRRLPSSNLISTPALSSTAAMVGEIGAPSSFGFLLRTFSWLSFGWFCGSQESREAELWWGCSGQ